MKQTKIIMGMPITIEIVDAKATKKMLQEVFAYFRWVDKKFSPYKKTSEVSLLNKGKITFFQISPEMKEILLLAKKTKQATKGYFDVYYKGIFDPSGIVKGWAIQNAAKILKKKGMKNFFVDAGGDIQASGKNGEGEPWRIGIRNPFNRFQNVKVVTVSEKGIATSGTAIRGQHIYNPHRIDSPPQSIVSLTVIGPNVYDADRFATAAFAMEKNGIYFIESLPGFEGYMIDSTGIATYTTGFDKYTVC